MKKLLHAGCGRAALPAWFGDKVQEVRVDIDPATSPDITANITDLGDIGQFDVVYSSHCVEHLYPQEVRVALAEFHRVTAPDGYTMVIVPDLEDVKATDEVLFHCPGGPLCGLDLIYGCHIDILQSPYMAHHSGFVSTTLEAALRDVGFTRVDMKRLPDYNLMAIARH
jgi:SAM-dependent methyltransferase